MIKINESRIRKLMLLMKNDNKKLVELVEDLFKCKPVMVKKLSDALTTNACRVHFDNRPNVILKIAYDDQDIVEKKGEKEKYLLDLLAKEVPTIAAPEVEGYWNAGEYSKGYIIALREMSGENLPIAEFNKVAVSKENIDYLVRDTLEYNSIQFDKVSDFGTFSGKTVEDYFDKYRDKSEKFLTKNNYPSSLINRLDNYELLKEYFSNKSIHLVHKDVKFNNILFNEGKFSGIIDWEGAIATPLAFDFAHTAILSKVYGYKKWINLYMERYIEMSGKKELKKEVEALLLFTSFRYMCRGHTSETKNQSDKVYINTINKWRFDL